MQTLKKKQGNVGLTRVKLDIAKAYDRVPFSQLSPFQAPNFSIIIIIFEIYLCTAPKRS